MFRHLLSSSTRNLRLSDPFRLESGTELSGVEIAYRTWGRPANEAVLICHALTGSADADDWWSGLLGEGLALDPRHHYIVASNVLGGCYGSTGPASQRSGPLPTNPVPADSDAAVAETNLFWGSDFPAVTIRDMVVAQAHLLDHLGIERLRLVIGGSMGGMQVLEWPLLFPDRVRSIAPLATSAAHSPWCIGISEAQRQAIFADERWRGGRYPREDPPRAGLAAARMMAMASYRSFASFGQRFSRQRRDDSFEVEHYLRRHGEKINDRFDPATYVLLTNAMDGHDVARGRGDQRTALRGITTPALVLGVTTDVLYPLAEQEELASLMPNAELFVLDSPHGHDAFLIEFEKVGAALQRFLARQ